jgi:uncharacterized membrane protein
VNPFDLPVHPALVHVPLAMLVAAWVCVLLQHRTGSAVWGERVRLFELVGVLGLAPTIAAGFVDLRGFSVLTDPRWDLPLVWHTLAALSGAALFTAHWAYRRSRGADGGTAVVDVGLATAGAWALLAAGAIAGEMVYAV